jgi:outer membrane lipoprotein SlyB
MNRNQCALGVSLAVMLLAAGCQTNTQEGALFGGATGGVLGAIVGHQFHNTAAGAAIGAGAGALTGAVVGNKIDEQEARNRAEIAARLGRPVGPGAVTNEDVIAMTKAGVGEDIIVSHVNNNGVARPLQTADLIYLQQNGVSSRVIATMQNPARSAPPPQTVVVQQAPPPVVYDGYYGPRYYHPYYGDPYYYRPPPAVGFGVVVR